MKKLLFALGLCGILLLPSIVLSIVLSPGILELEISNLNVTAKTISFSVSPSKDLKSEKSLCICFFSPKEGTDAFLNKLDVRGGAFNYSIGHNEQPEYWSGSVSGKNGSYLGPLVIQRISDKQITEGKVQVYLDKVWTTGTFGIPDKFFPTNKKTQIALARETEEQWHFLVISNVLIIEPTALR